MCFIMASTLNGNHGDFDGIGRRQTIGLQLADARGSRHQDGEVARGESPRRRSRLVCASRYAPETWGRLWSSNRGVSRSRGKAGVAERSPPEWHGNRTDRRHASVRQVPPVRSPAAVLRERHRDRSTRT